MDTLLIKHIVDSEKIGLYHGIISYESTTNNDILITAIICSTIIVLALFLLIYFCFVKEKRKEVKTAENNKHFLDFCYEMAKSENKGNEAIGKECWEILKKKFLVNGNTKSI